MHAAQWSGVLLGVEADHPMYVVPAALNTSSDGFRHAADSEDFGTFHFVPKEPSRCPF